MPIQIYVDVNGKPAKTYHIARVHKNVNNDELTDYAVLETAPTVHRDGSYNGPRYSKWDEGIVIQHKRSDGMETLLRKVFEGLEENSEK